MPFMIKMLQIFLLPFLVLYLTLTAGYSNTSPIYLQWMKPGLNSEESTFISSLYFQGAVFSDSLPEIPVYIHRQSLLEQYSGDFLLKKIEVELCTPEEVRILETSGFSLSDFHIGEDTEISSGEHYSRLHIIPVRKNHGVYEKIISLEIHYTMIYAPVVKSLQSVHQYPESSVLSKGDWFRICVEKEGIYRLTRQDLVDLGMNPLQVQKSTIQLYGNGGGMLPESNAEARITDLRENSIWVSGSNSGNFGQDDFILFYGQSPNRWIYKNDIDAFEHQVHYYSNETCYFLTHSQGNGKRLETSENLNIPATHTVTTFYDYALHERDNVNLLGSGKIWFGEVFDATLSRTVEFSFPNIVQQQPMEIALQVAARASVMTSFQLEVSGESNAIPVSAVNVANVTGLFAQQSTRRFNFLPQGENVQVLLSYTRSQTAARGWLNYMSVNARRHLKVTGDQMFFRNPSVSGKAIVAKFEISDFTGNHTLWDVTNPFDVKLQQVQRSGNTGTFTVSSEQLKEFVVFTDRQFLKPTGKGRVPNQNLHAMELHDLTIVVPDVFRQEAERLAEFRRNFDGLTVALVSPQQIYNEFSSGVTDISAIRNFMKMFYDRAIKTGNYPKYLLLFGNGTYDNKNILGFGGNFIPTFQTLQSLNPANSYISDDFFGLLDNNEGFDAQGAIDLGIGRLPVRTVDEARFVVDKITRYNQRFPGLEPGSEDPRFAGVISNYSDWRNVISFIADDEDGNIHFNQTEAIAKYLAENYPVLNLDKIYLDAYEQVTLAGGSRYPEVNKAINNRVNQGALLINYIGHGGTQGLAQERILTFDDILSWGNYYNLPVFMTATCEFSSFDQPDANALSAGVRVFLKPDGGAAALFTTTRLAYSHSNFTLNDAFIRNAFKPMPNGLLPRLGDLIRIAKVQSSSVSTLKNFVLLGDPSMQLAYPKFKAVTTMMPDTIKALDMVTVKGEIHTPAGTRAVNYNGIIYPVVYDKNNLFQTRANDRGSNVAGFQLRNRIIYRGAAQIVNGEYEFSFIVPRDINYNYGNGKISYYFDDGKQFDGCGYFDNFAVAGTSTDYVPDNDGPKIELYLDNKNFKSGGKTGPSPILLAYLHDESGINTTGQIGHDIVAFLNNDTSNPFILNNFYQTNTNSYKSGKVVYPFFNLEKGEYTLTLRAWDVHNNVSTNSIDFIVTSAPDIMLTQMFNFPNPFSDKTQFSIAHNKPATELNVAVEIFSLTGQRVKLIEQNIYASGYNIPPIEWDGRDEGGTLLGNGIYIFRAIVRTAEGDQVQRTEKLVILR
jgi:hypothetical protein